MKWYNWIIRLNRINVFTKFLILSSLVVNCVVFDMVYSMRYVDGIRVLRICFWNGEGLLHDEDLIFQLKV